MYTDIKIIKAKLVGCLVWTKVFVFSLRLANGGVGDKHITGSLSLETYSHGTARFKLYARDYILANINTFSPSSQPIAMLASKDSMLASKGSILASKGSMLSCMILLAIEIDARVRLLSCTHPGSCSQ